MTRAGLPALVLVLVSGCSLILDFSPAALPPDSSPDGPYSQAECDYLEPNNAVAEAMVLTPADVGPAAICLGEPADRDFYRFTVPAGTASVSASVTFVNALGDLDIRITDTGGMMLGQSRGFEDVEQVKCPGTSPMCRMLDAGDYVLEVFGATPGAVNRYEIALTITPMM